MKILGRSTVKSLTVKISGMRMASYILLQRQTTKNTSGENTSGPLGKLRVNPVVNDPNPTGKNTTDLVIYSKPKSKNPTETSSGEK